MVDSIEAFVGKLQAEGVQAGQNAARKIIEDAQAEADTLISASKCEADEILNAAKKESQKIVQRGQTELALSARDAVLGLQAALSANLQDVLAHGAASSLNDSEFIKNLLHEIVINYANADIAGNIFEFNLQPEMQQKLSQWAITELAHKVTSGKPMNMKGTLATAGFEYTAGKAKIEVTLDSVVQTLSNMVSPMLRQILQNNNFASSAAAPQKN